MLRTTHYVAIATPFVLLTRSLRGLRPLQLLVTCTDVTTLRVVYVATPLRLLVVTFLCIVLLRSTLHRILVLLRSTRTIVYSLRALRALHSYYIVVTTRITT